MRGAGFDVTQATLSRDIRELGLVKGGPKGAYQAPPTGRDQRPDAERRCFSARWRRSCGASIECSSWCCCAPGSGMRSRSARCSMAPGSRCRRDPGRRGHDPDHHAGHPACARAREAAGGDVEPMKSPVVLAYRGWDPRIGGDSLARRHDGRRSRDRHARCGSGTRARRAARAALACGAVRAHVVDARDDFARDVLVPSLSRPSQPTHRGHRSPGCRGRSSRESSPRSRASKAPARSRMARPTRIRRMDHAVDSSIPIIAPPRVDDERRRSDRVARARVVCRSWDPRRQAAASTRTCGGRSWEGDDEPSAVRAPPARGRGMNQHWWTFISSAACQPP